MGAAVRIPQSQVERYSEAISACKSDDEFQAWFNKADNADHAKANGFWDFAIHIATPLVRQHLGSPHKKTALEIGCGGGRLLGAASYYFHHVVGLDIHASLDRVSDHLVGRGIRNFSLVRGDGEHIPLPDQSVDFVYSFIVLQHLQSGRAFSSYVMEAKRCLSPGGLAMIYYGKREKTVEVDGPPNTTTLAMSREDAVTAARNADFELLDEGESWRFGEEKLRRGYQGFMLLRR